MEIPAILKKPPVIIGGVVLVVVILVVSKKGSVSSISGNGSYASQLAATQAANIQIAQVNAATEQARLQAGVATISASLGGQASLANIEAQRIVALSKIASDEAVSLTGMDYQYAVSNKQLENNRILGLTTEDTKRLTSTQENQTRLTLGVRALDVQQYIADRALSSQELLGMREYDYRERALESGERVADFTSSRALTYAGIQGANQVAAAEAAKPSPWTAFLGSLGGGLGGGIGKFLGNL